MNEKVIEPSEIIVEQLKHKRQRQNALHANPWIRFLARFFDYALLFLLLLWFRRIFHGQIPFGKYEHFIPFEFFIWIPIEALCLSTWGLTPGKWFFRTKLKQGKKSRLDYMTALRRSFSVWFRGLGMGIPGLNFFCLALAYHKLKVFQITSWDRDDHIQITHHPIGTWRLYTATAVIAILFSAYYWTCYRN